MKLSVILFTAATALTAAYADDAPATVGPNPESTTAAPTTAPTSAGSSSTTTTPAKTTKTPSTTTSTPSATGAGNSNAAASTLDKLTQKASGYTYQMPYVRVVQARVQSDKPEWNKDRFVSTYGKGDRVKGYMSSMDTVNTASVEGALMYVQAEGINQNSRSADNRCIRKNNMNWVVLYEILIAQTNETIAQFENTWNVREYGPMIPMDGGQCTPLSGSTFPPECLQFNGDKGQPNVGPFVGAGLKNNDVRAPYPDNYWFSFPHTCPLKKWNDKIADGDTCRASTRKGLCDIGVAPDGIECTFAYDILGWVPIDDVVGITSLTDDNGKAYGNFTQWCQASTKHIEFAGNDKTGEMTEGLDFWKDPLDPTKNAERANKVIEVYQKMIDGSFVSTQVTADDVSHFKALPDPADLAKKNPPCYKSVRSCNSGNGCERLGFSQICFPCDKASDTCKVDKAYTLPKLAKAPTTLSEEDLTSGSKLSDTTGANSNQNGTKTKSDAIVATGSRAAAIATALAVGVAAVLAL